MKRTILIAGGGTGGHVFPAIALAEEFRARGHDVIMIGTAEGLEAKEYPKSGLEFIPIRTFGIKGKSLRSLFSASFVVPQAILQAMSVLRSKRPGLVLGVGGYASAPAGIAAVLLRIPLALQEQNSIPGFTNRMLARWARGIFVGFERTRAEFPASVRPKIEVTGNPIRISVLNAAQFGTTPHFPSPTGFRVLVMGGSQGAQALNHSIMEIAMSLDEKSGISIVHQTGARDFPAIERWAKERAPKIHYECFAFSSDLHRYYSESDLIVSRSGALSVSEILVFGRPSILIPYPFAADNHQWANAREIADAGAAVLLPQSELSGEKLMKKIVELKSDSVRLKSMQDAARRLAPMHSTERIVSKCEEWV